MNKIRDILCFSTPYEEMYRIEDGLAGTIIYRDEELFEGILTDQEYNDIYYIFGKKTNNEIDIIRSSKGDIELPKLYHGKKENKKYYGDIYVKNRFVEIPIGECQVSILNPETCREINANEEKQLEKRISILKNNLGEETIYLVEEMFKKEKENTK